ncbi:unnamed protein product [Echinostoma caproni]|uniref:DDE_Tnp_1_7 domain-containing protein n=1 Tax=Echinostoma caproni TaxID=27848 RepID=A0A183B700_9TREM|nr:unnamed protein product [Echinostoma caproni]
MEESNTSPLLRKRRFLPVIAFKCFVNHYDITALHIRSFCLRKIGWYVREYQFVESEDIFLLNRTLSLVAKFLEANPIKPPSTETPPPERRYSTVLRGSLEDEPPRSPESTDSDDPIYTESSNQGQNLVDIVEDDDDDGDVQDAPDAEEQRMSSYLGIVSGDPDAEATLKLILKLQEREMYGISSDSSTDEVSPGGWIVLM